MNKKDYPLQVLKDLSTTLKTVRFRIRNNEPLVRLVQESGTILVATDQDNKFYFKILKVSQGAEQKTFFTVHYRPTRADILNDKTFELRDTQVIQKLDGWISFLAEYDQIELDENEHLVNMYEKEYYTQFEIVDDHFGAEALEEKAQLLLYELLTATEERIEQQGAVGDSQELLEETRTLKNNLSNLNRQQTGKAISKLFAKIRKSGISLVKFVVTESLKEGVKMALKQGYTHFDDIKTILLP